MNATFKICLFIVCFLTPPIGWVVFWLYWMQERAAHDAKMCYFADLADRGMLGDKELLELEQWLRKSGA